MSDKPNFKYLNRELSWLEFNQRVLDEARDESVPLLDRLFFLSVTASNLDEFFMVRMGGMKLLLDGDVDQKDASGLTTSQQYARCLERVRRMVADQYDCWRAEILPGLSGEGLRIVSAAEFSEQQRAFVRHYVEDIACSELSPVAVRPRGIKPVLINGALYMAVMLEPQAEGLPPRFAVLRLGRRRWLNLPSEEGKTDVTLIENAVADNLRCFFEGRSVLDHACFRITRNADIPVREEYAEDLAVEMESVLAQRRSSDCVRLELASGATDPLRDFVVELADARQEEVFELAGPLDFAGMAPLCKLEGFGHLRYPPWPPQPSARIDAGKSVFGQIAQGDILISLPFERFDPVLKLVQEASTDPDVLAIKIILYRTSERSPIVRALSKAAQAGKSVTAVIELKARFDEQANIAWARAMEAMGVQVVFGIKGYKTHAKACMVVRREDGAITRYLHLATGNYNESTAKLYTDVGLLTCDAALGADLSAFFHAVTGYSEPQSYHKITQAPIGLRERLLALIEGETQRARAGDKGRIMAKMSSLVDRKLVDALYEASRAGVDIQLNVRGICVLRPGVPGLSENIRVVSIVDRLLEHSRIFWFRHGGDDKIFISSADWMPRNLDRRIELLVPVEDADSKRQLKRILRACLSDKDKGREILPDGGYLKPKSKGKGKGSQAILYRQACDEARKRSKNKTITFEPHRPSKKNKNQKSS